MLYLIYLSNTLILIVPLLVAVAYLTLAERNVIGYMQNSNGPNVVGAYGILQPLADGLNLFSNENILPNHANTFVYILAPILSFTLALIAWAVIPFHEGTLINDLNLGILYLFAVSSVSVYSILMSGWASNSNYAFLGALSAAAQLISYEVSIGLIILTVILCAGSLSLVEIASAQQNSLPLIIPLLPAAAMFLVSALAETNSAPFDLTEGESELVSGYNVEYSSMQFALFFLAEYSHIILMSFLFAVLFLGSWNPFGVFAPIWLAFNASIVILTFVWVRSSFPSISYDQLMALLWNSYLPLSLGFLALTAGLLIGLNALPPIYI